MWSAAWLDPDGQIRLPGGLKVVDFSNPQFINGCGFHAVLKNNKNMITSLEKLDLPAETLQTLMQQLHLDS